MKKIVKYILFTCLGMALLFAGANRALAATASLTCDKTAVRAGDTITLSLKLSDDGKLGFEGAIKYDKSLVTMTEISCGLDGWEYEGTDLDGDKADDEFIVYDDKQTKPLNGMKNVLTLKFKVGKNVPVGTPIDISVEKIVTTDGNNETNVGNVTYSTTVAAPLSVNANLSSLTVAEGTLNPAFAANKTTYDLGEVEFSVSKLTITAVAEDEKAKVTIKNNTLAVGQNTVSVEVKAENGSVKTYKINVTRKQDPNYQANSNAKLSNLTVSLGMISPLFSADVKNYVVYLPYECAGQTFTATGKCEDKKALGVTDGVIAKLAEGKNETTVIGTAEDGTTLKYKVTVVVMPKYSGKLPYIGDEPQQTPGGNDDPADTPSESESESETENAGTENNTGNPGGSENDTTQPSEPGSDKPSEKPGNVFAQMDLLTTILVVLVVIALVGVLVYVLFFSNRRKK